jgi:hypothetical protein
MEAGISADVLLRLANLPATHLKERKTKLWWRMPVENANERLSASTRLDPHTVA